MTVQGDIATVLEANAALMAVLTGGVHQMDEVGEISRQNTPGVFDANGELKPCALIGEGTEVPRGPYDHDGVGTSVGSAVTVYFYEREGYASIENAMGKVFTLLARKKVGNGTWRVEYESSIRNQADQALQSSLGLMRFVVVRLRG